MLDWFLQLIQKFGQTILNALPLSPFDSFIQGIGNIDYLGYLNWFIPVGTFIKILLAWVTAIGVFYIYSIIMRWVKMIGD